MQLLSFENSKMIRKHNLDKSKMSAEYVEQLIQKLESLDLETEDKERIYLRRLEKIIIQMGKSTIILLMFHFLNYILSK